MPDGERVTTGSEPRRTFTLYRDKFAHDSSITSDWRVAEHWTPKPDEAREVVEVQEVVEPGHDEQTWDHEDLVQVIRAELATGSYMNPSELLPYEDKARDIARVIEERFKPSAPGGADAGG